jgi:hypothetical protein
MSLMAIPVVVREKLSPVSNEKYPFPGLVILVSPVNLQTATLPSKPEVPEVPEVPEDPLDPEVPLGPETPLVPEVPLVPLVPPEMLVVNEENAIWPEVPEVPPV